MPVHYRGQWLLLRPSVVEIFPQLSGEWKYLAELADGRYNMAEDAYFRLVDTAALRSATSGIARSCLCRAFEKSFGEPATQRPAQLAICQTRTETTRPISALARRAVGSRFRESMSCMPVEPYLDDGPAMPLGVSSWPWLQFAHEVSQLCTHHATLILLPVCQNRCVAATKSVRSNVHAICRWKG